jgi:pyrimidine-nucleoside phosphorylase
MNPASLIQKKRDGLELKAEEITQFIEGLTRGDVADYQATAMLMAIFFRGMSASETVALTRAMLESGERYDLSKIPGSKVDKHSTGGVGDKVSLILAPLAAACGLKVPMMSGRGLGHSGGTLDKLESIPGFNVHLKKEEFFKILNDVGCAMIGQSERMVPADRTLYSLRDVTATVECIPLIVASILSKKLAEGADALVLDVKFGSGAFMKNLKHAKELAKTLVSVSKKLGLPCQALLTSMEQPLGYAVGNSLEVLESIEILRGEKWLDADTSSADLKELTLALCAQMLQLSGRTRSISEARKLAALKLQDGSAWKVFRQMIAAQGGDLATIDSPLTLPLSKRVLTWKTKRAGYITAMQTDVLGNLLVEMGGGRKKASDPVDPRVGLVFHRKLGARVTEKEVLATVYAPENERIDLGVLEKRFHEAIEISKTRKAVPKLILGY